MALVLGLLLPAVAVAQRTLPIQVTGGKLAMKNVPVRVALSLPPDWAAKKALLIKLPGGAFVAGQLTEPSLRTDIIEPAAPKYVRRDLHFILPSLKADTTITVAADFDGNVKDGTFAWTEQGDDYAELSYRAEPDAKGRPVLRYMRRPYDPTTKEKRDRSYKVFHHLYDPTGTRFVTNGGFADPYTDAKKLLYPHHRGLMYAFNRITYDGGKKADTWHCTGGAHQSHLKTLLTEAGPVLGRHRVLIGWYGAKDELFAREERELTAYAVPGGTLVEFASQLRTVDGKVHLDGDPQHAGFQFRASNEVAAKTSKQTYYLRPDGKGLLGQTRNWDPKTKEGPVDLPWDALSFVVGGKRYTVEYMNRPTNPKESRFSERDYGRFGCYFVYDLTKERPLRIDYRLWLQVGEMTVEQAQAKYRQFAAAPRAVVKR